MEAVITNFGDYLQAFLLTFELFAAAALCSLLLGVLLAAARAGPVSVLARAASLYVTIFRNTPLLMIFIFVFIALPKMQLNIDSFLVKGVVALSLYTAAFVCEAFRSGINSVPLGQAEASRAIGLDFGQSMQLVVLPQALRAVVPPLVSVLIALVKNTSVAAAFGLLEAAAQMRGFLNDYADQKYELFIAFALGYIVIVELLSLTASRLERRWKVAR